MAEESGLAATAAIANATAGHVASQSGLLLAIVSNLKQGTMMGVDSA